MRFRPVKQTRGTKHAIPVPAPAPVPPRPPQMDNPYSRHFTQPRTLESLRRTDKKL